MNTFDLTFDEQYEFIKLYNKYSVTLNQKTIERVKNFFQ